MKTRKDHLLIKIFLPILIMVLSNVGCAPLLLRNLGLDGKYSEIVVSLDDIQQGKGRVFIYMTSGAPEGLIGSNAYRDREPLTVDKDIYIISGQSFFYVDLPEGDHKISIGNVLVPGLPSYYQIGENVLDFQLGENECKYVKINTPVERENRLTARPQKDYVYIPIIIDKENAEKEIYDLRYDKRAITKNRIKE